MSINIKDGNNKSMDEGKDRSEKHLRKRKDKEHKLRNKKIKKDKFKKVKINNFEIISEKYSKMLKIDNVCKLNQFGGAKTFNNSFLITATVVDLNMIKIHHYSNLKKCFEIKELNYNSEKNDQKKNVNSYLVESFNKEIIADKKIKYNESEVIISSNVININLEKIRKIIDNERISKNGLSLDELKIRKKRKNQKISNVEKVKKIIDNIKKESIMEKILKGKKNSLNNNNYYFCLDCYEYNDNNEIENEHKGHFIIEINDFKDLEDELDYNEKLNKIYEILKNEQNQILQNGNNNLILYYTKLLFSLYEVIINDNSFEELYSSIIRINENYSKENEKGTFSDNYKDIFFLFCQIISQLAYLKAQEISLNETNEDTDINFDELEDENILKKINLDECSEEGKKKYFFELGFSLKNKNNKNISISELYSKAIDENISINDYENFFKLTKFI